MTRANSILSQFEKFRLLDLPGYKYPPENRSGTQWMFPCILCEKPTSGKSVSLWMDENRNYFVTPSEDSNAQEVDIGSNCFAKYKQYLAPYLVQTNESELFIKRQRDTRMITPISKDLDKGLFVKRAGLRHLFNTKRWHHGLEGRRFHHKLGRFLATRDTTSSVNESNRLIGLVSRLNSMKYELAKAAQNEYDAWSQDEEGFDWEVGTGGICNQIAEAMADVINDKLHGAHAFTDGNNDMNHTWVFVCNYDYDEVMDLTDEPDDFELVEVDIPYSTYETGGGYNWKKIPNVRFDASDVEISKSWTGFRDYKYMLRYESAATKAGALLAEYNSYYKAAVMDIMGGDFGEDPNVDYSFTRGEPLAYLATLKDMYKKYGEPIGKGSYRVVFNTRGDDYVVKVPLNSEGESDNQKEYELFRQNKLSHFAKCNLVSVNGIDVLMMERLYDVMRLASHITPHVFDQESLDPGWIRKIDAAQVGVSRDGRVKAYDFSRGTFGDQVHDKDKDDDW